MPEQIIGSPDQKMLWIGAEGQIAISGIVGVGDVTGSFYEIETIPTAVIKNNPEYEFIWMASGTATGVTGSSIGSIWMTLNTGSYVQSLTWSNDNLTDTSAWSIL